MYKKKAENTPAKMTAVGYFNHFPFSFLKPYGPAADPPTEDEILRKVKPVNCEWLVRPKVGVSEFSETMWSNLEILANTDSHLINTKKVTAVQAKMSAFIDALKKLDTKYTETGPPTPLDVKQMLKSIIGANKETQAFFNEATTLGAAMYQVGIQFTVLQSVLSNPDWFAENAVGLASETKQFKANPTIGGMKAMLTELCTKDGHRRAKSKTTQQKRKLAALLDSDNESEEDSSTSTIKKAKTKTKQPVQELESDDDDIQENTIADSENQKEHQQQAETKKERKNTKKNKKKRSQ